MKKTVSIVIVTWNGRQLTLACLASLAKLETSGFDVRIIVVDNGSRDTTTNEVRKKFPAVDIISLRDNRGFSGGNNVGIRQALREKSDCLWLLNNDTVVDSQALSLAAPLRDSHVGITGSKIYFAQGHEYHKDRYRKGDLGKVLWYAGGSIDWANMYASHRGVDEVDHGQYDDTQDTPFVTGCSMMIRRQVFERIGLFDEKFYLYLEDVDFCIRARGAGFRVLYVPPSVVWHVNAESSGGPGNPLHNYYLTRNRYLIGFRFAPLRTKMALLRESLRFLLDGSREQKRAVRDALLGRFGKQYEPQ